MKLRSKGLALALQYGLKRAAGVPYVPLQQAAHRTYRLCEAAEVPALTPFMWDSHLPRIRGAARYSVQHTIEKFLKRKTFQFRPVALHWLQDAILIDGSVYSRGHRQDVRQWGNRSRMGFSIAGPSAEIESAAMVSTTLGSTWWGHWLEDEVPLQLLAEQFAAPVGHHRDCYRDEAEFRAALNVSEVARYGIAAFRELLVIEDHGQNPDKTRRYHELRGRLRHRPQGHDRVFLSRGASGSRRVLVNETELRTRLEQLGFVTIDVASASADTLISACRGASIVVSVEGSHLAPLLYLLRDFGTMVILNPPYQVQTTVATVALFCSISSGMFICDPHRDSRTDFVADADEVIRFVDASERFSRDNQPRTAAFVQSVLRLAPPAAAGHAASQEERSERSLC